MNTPKALLTGVAAVLIWSLIGCRDFFTWLLEVFPVLAGVPVLILLYSRLRFTNLLYCLIAVHAGILMIGGHYTYAQMPVFEWIKQWFHLSRNYYDRVGHFAQGFVPAMIAREWLLRTTPLGPGKLMAALVMGVCMGISALYELFEFAAAKLTGSAADAFLGSQGDPWDTQWDMTFCLIGATCALVFLSRLHNRAIAKVQSGDQDAAKQTGPVTSS